MDQPPPTHDPDLERGIVLYGAPRESWRICRRCGALLAPEPDGTWRGVFRPECGEPYPPPPDGMRSWER